MSNKNCILFVDQIFVIQGGKVIVFAGIHEPHLNHKISGEASLFLDGECYMDVVITGIFSGGNNPHPPISIERIDNIYLDMLSGKKLEVHYSNC